MPLLALTVSSSNSPSPQSGSKELLRSPFFRRASDSGFSYGATGSNDDTDTEVSFGFTTLNSDDDFEVGIAFGMFLCIT